MIWELVITINTTVITIIIIIIIIIQTGIIIDDDITTESVWKVLEHKVCHPNDFLPVQDIVTRPSGFCYSLYVLLIIALLIIRYNYDNILSLITIIYH